MVSGRSVNDQQGSNALVFGARGMCKCVHLHHADIWLSKLRDAVMEDVVKYS